MSTFIKHLLSMLIIILALLVFWIIATGGQEVFIWGQKIGLRNPKNPSILLVLLLSVRFYYFSDNSMKDITTRAYNAAFFGLFFFVISVLGVKTFIALITVYYFKLELSLNDLKHYYSADLSFAFVYALIMMTLLFLSQTVTLIKSIANVGLILVSLIAVTASLYYILAGYIYFEWGSYLEPNHFIAMNQAGVGPEAADLILRWRTLGIFVAVVLFLRLAKQIIIKMNNQHYWRYAGGLLFILAPAVMTANVPLTEPTKIAPSAQSPLFLLAQPMTKNSLAIDADHLLGKLNTKTASYRPAQYDAPIKSKYQPLQGIAKGKNLIIFVMESARRQSLPLYGYHRETMPTINKLAENSIVFDQAYITQPRSSKAMAALALGVTPDPRLKAIAWNERRFKDKDSLFNRLIDDNRRMYIGTAQRYGRDNLQKYFNATTANRADTIVAFETLEKEASISNDDVGLATHFSQWAGKSKQPFVGLLWSECAHIPYKAPKTPYGSNQLIDKYDNCLRAVDEALDTLLTKLAAQGQLEETVFLIMGDHGEALGEKFDRGHGSYLYDHSIRIPMLIYNPSLFEQRIDSNERFQIKDIPSTLLYLFGLDDRLNQSVNIFSKQSNDTLYFSNVYQDFKLGLMQDQLKFVYRPTYDLTYVYDLDADPNENNNVAHRFDRNQLAQMKKQTLLWYQFHTNYIESSYPINK